MNSESIIIGVQKLKCGFSDWFFRTFTYLGDEIFVVLFIAVIFWCFSKRKAFNLSIVYVASVAFTYGLKKLIDAPRPPAHLRDELTLGSAGSASFPSGHANSSATYTFATASGFARKKWWAYAIAFAISAIVALSRIYLGHHFLSDVLAGLLIGGFIGFIGMIVMERLTFKEEWWALMLVPMLIMLFFIESEELYMAFGALTALLIGYNVEKRFLKVEIPKNWLVKISRSVIGVSVAVALYYLLGLIPKSNAMLVVIAFIIGLWIFLGAVFVFKYTDIYVQRFYDYMLRRRESKKQIAE